ncbi:hypothetical protein D8674_018482 [Pyrus ussuriensis x Pyrus communis]|uniref:Uncharacterized protein n=1 Tax=Pyrus ussuriensis x Pyrus communis TaxID=2448454 RepID=A0A5N5GAA0_9ROSA|nr:hypothetical protein D8674_018482 [Pyrus ussuriensis x Pyrus communis]
MVIASSSIAATVEKMEVEVSSAAENNPIVQEHGALAVGGQISNAKKETNGGHAKNNKGNAKKRERPLQAKLQEHMAKRTTADNSDDVPISESDSIASVLRSQAAQAHTEELEAIMAMLPESNEICEAVRIEPYVVDAEGHAFWKPKSDFGEDILLQDMRTWDGAPSVENWFFVALK